MCTHSVLHVFCATFLCTTCWSHFSSLFFLLHILFLVYGCALLCCLYVHCICHSPVLQVYTFLHCVHPSLCQSCDWLCQRCGLHDLHLSTSSGALILCCALRESASLVVHFEHVPHFMHTYSELPGRTLENCTRKMVCGL